jgi:hypothetical protein
LPLALDGALTDGKSRELKIGKSPDRCLITVAADKVDLFEVLKGLLDEGLIRF